MIAPPRLADPRLFGVAFAAVAIASGLIVAQNVAVPMTWAIEALPLALWLFAGFGIGSTLLRAIRLDAAVTLRVVTATAFGLGAIGVAVHLLGLAGWLNAVTAWGVIGVGLVTGAVQLMRHRRAIAAAVSAASSLTPRKEAAETAAATRSSWHWLLLAIAIPVGVSLAAATVPPGILWGDEPHGYDVVEYHFQVPREWYEAGRISPLPHNVFSFLPLLTEMHYLLAMHLRGGPWAGMYLAQMMHWAIVWLVPVAVYGVVGGGWWVVGGKDKVTTPSRLLSHPPPTTHYPLGVLAALACAAPPWLSLLGGVAYDDGALMLYSTLAIGWLLRARRWNDALVAGAFAGFACSSKLSAAPLVGVIAPTVILIRAVTLFVSPAARGRFRPNRPRAAGLTKSAREVDGSPSHGLEYQTVAPARTIARLAIYLVTLAIVFAPQAIRNLAWAGNPLFPEMAELLGGPFSPGQVERWRAAHTPTESHRSIGGRFAAAMNQIGGVGFEIDSSGDSRLRVTDFRFGYALPFAAIIVIAAAIVRYRFLYCPIVTLKRTPSPRNRGEGGGEGPATSLAEHAASTAAALAPHPSPLPGYGEKEAATGDRVHALSSLHSSVLSLAIIVVLHLVVWLLFTHLQGRFFVAAIPLMAMLVAATPWPRVTSIVMTLALLGGVAITLARYNAPGGTLAIGLTVAGIDNVDELRPLQHDSPADRPLALIGDASAFFYKRPMTSLIYRTVFDLDDRASDPIAAYLRDDPRGKDATLLIDPGELGRFAKTYRHVATPSAEIARDGRAYLRAR